MGDLVTRDRSWPPLINGVAVPYETPVQELGELLRTQETASIAAMALAHEGSRESLMMLKPLLYDDARDWRARRLGVEAIGRHPLGNEFAPRVLELVHDPVPQVVWAASLAAASLGLNEAVPHFLVALDSSDRLVSSGAHNALYKLSLPGDLDILIDKYRDADYERRKSIGTLICVRVHPAVWRDVFDLFESSDVAGDRELAARLAHEFGGSDTLPSLKALADDRDGHVRGAAERAIVAITKRGGVGGYGDYNESASVSPYKLGRDSES